MSLSEYLSTISQRELAKRLGVSQGLVSQWLNKKTRLTPERAVEISKLSGGTVKPSDLLPDFEWE